MIKYQPVIGLEVHVELNTKTKMFCKCSADYFGKEPNTHVCPICLGLPGSLPYINKEAINKCIQIGLALNCGIAEKSLFERKNYFYPDLPKGYQISQYRWPLCTNGSLKLEDGRLIRINRVHEEEDTGKMSHPGGVTLIDFNRSGVPLVEIVSEPDFTDTDQVKDYAKALQQVFRYLGVSNADMEKGDMRLEANVSVKREGEKGLPFYRVELKNINSFNFMVNAVKYEIDRQIKALGAGQKLLQETRGWDEQKKQTYIQRVKEGANDYRYFPEPDLPEIRTQMSEVRKVRAGLPEMHWNKIERFVTDYGLSQSNARVLTQLKELADFFEDTVEHGKKHRVETKDIANYLVNQEVDIENTLPTQVVETIIGKSVGIISEEGQLTKLVQEAINENPDIVKSYKRGKTQALEALLGVVMRKASGKADATKVKDIFKGLLDS